MGKGKGNTLFKKEDLRPPVGERGFWPFSNVSTCTHGALKYHPFLPAKTKKVADVGRVSVCTQCYLMI